MAEHRAVQIFMPTNGGRYALNNNALERILSQQGVADKPVAVYSLAGAFRQGKSFMLNLFMRFLQSGRSDEWLRNKTEMLDKGFGWSGGKDRCTQGIWMWSEPFHVSTKDGEIVIFLLDTQGTFDHESSMQQCSLIFALSTLISSFQIFNLMRQIQENDLQHLQLFTEYGKMTKSATAVQTQEKAFQGLMFLIRDWHDPDYVGLDGGREVLAGALKVRSKHKDLMSVRQNIRDSFEKVDCFLLTEPGKKVARRSKNAGPLVLKDIDEEFLEEVDFLVRYLFLENIAVKRVNGNCVTGIDLINFTIAYCKIFESGKMPEIGTILEASAKAAILTTIQKCIDDYRTRMNKECEGRYVNELLLSEFHRQFKADSLKLFDSLPKMGDRQFIAGYRQHLSKSLKDVFGTIEQYNNAHRESLKTLIRDTIDEAGKKFTSSLESLEANQHYVDDETLPRTKQECEDAAVAFFVDSTKGYDEGLVGGYNDKLHELLNQEFERFQETNLGRKNEFIRKLSDMSLQAMKKYRNSMDEKCEGRFLTNGKFVAAHDQAASDAFAEFSSNQFGDGTSDKETVRLNMEADIKKEKQKYEKTNGINKQLDDAKALKLITEAKEKYKNLMTAECGNGYCIVSTIDRSHSKCKVTATKSIEYIEAEKGREFADKCRSQLSEVLEDALKNIKSKNMDLKTAAKNRFQEKAYSALNNYTSAIGAHQSDYVDETVLGNINKRLKMQAISAYTAYEGEPRDDYQSILQHHKDNLDREYQSAVSKNETNKEKARQKVNERIQSAKAEFKEKMQDEIGEKYFDTDALETMQKKAKDEAMNMFKNDFKMFPDMLIQCGNEIEEEFTNIKKINEENREKLLREQSNDDGGGWCTIL